MIKPAMKLWLVEHPPVFTQGQAGKEEHLLMPGDIEVVKVDRGGQVNLSRPRTTSDLLYDQLTPTKNWR